jgi:hypothetical protein
MSAAISVAILASSLSTSVGLDGNVANEKSRPRVPQIWTAQFQPQVPMGRVCVTRFGSCPIPPRPLNTQCYCGNVSGTAR